MRSPNRIAAVALALALGAAATAQDNKTDVKPVTDAEFVIKAASGGMFEVESSRLAKDAAKSDEVKKFAEKMIADHEKANKELMEVAKKANLGLPVKMLDEHQKMLDRVKGAKGEGFDKAYMETQVAAHDEAVTLFTSAAKGVRDPGLKAFAEKTLPAIKEHHEHAKHHGKGDTGDKKDK
jgi:putative membrane protein